MKKLMMTTAAMVLLGTTQASADFWAYGVGEEFAPEEFTVTGDATGYKQVSGHDKVTFDARLQYDTGVAGRIVSWRMEPRIKIGSDDVNPFWLADYDKGTSYPAFNRPKEIDIQTTMFVSTFVLKNFILAACNARLQERLDNGMPSVQAFGTEATVKIKYALHAEVNANGAGSGNPHWLIESGDKSLMGVAEGSLVRCKPIVITPDMPGTVKAPKPAKPGSGLVKAPKPARLPEIGARPQPNSTPGTAPGQRPRPTATLVPVRPTSGRPQTAGRP